jgi:DNA-binding NarL/FixJ family response regulator
MKKELTRHIMNAIQEVATGELYLSDTMKRHLLQSLTAPSRTGSLQTLTQREFQVLQLYGQGLSTAEIAEKLNLSRKTIETYNLRIRKKMQLRSFYELIALGSKFAP